MAVEIEGEVKGTGRVKTYDDYYGTTHKFFIEVMDDDGETYKTMVEVEDPDDPEREAWHYEGVGDRVRYTVQKTKNRDEEGALWTTSCTLKREFERLTTAGEDHYEEVKAKEREKEQERREREKERRKKYNEALNERLDEIYESYREAQRDDPRIPDDVAGKISKTFDLDEIVKLLKDTFYLGPIPEGTGGKRAMMRKGDYKVGTGMRRPHGALYDMPEAWRSSILNKAEESGIIEHVEEGYIATGKGVRLLAKLDRCPECGDIKVPFVHEVHTKIYHSSRSASDISRRALVTKCPDCEDISGHHGVDNFSESYGMQEVPDGLLKACNEVGDVEVPDYIDEYEQKINDAPEEVREDLGLEGDE